MSIFIKEFIKNKMRHLTVEELLQHSKNYGFELTNEEAKNIIHYYHTNDIDPFNTDHRELFFKKLAVITDQQTAHKAHRLFVKMIQHYNLEHLF